MKKALRYSSHIPVLAKLLPMSRGPVLEMGTGYFSTPLLHWMCLAEKKLLTSYETNSNFYNAFTQFNTEHHKVIFVSNYDDAPIEKPWGLAFIDHAPALRRVVDIKRLANCAEYVIIHDSDGKEDKKYRYKEIYPLFNYSYTFAVARPYTTVLSNFHNLEGFYVS